MLACERHAPGELVVLTGPQVNYRHSPTLGPCAGNLDAVNAYVTYAAAATRIPPEAIPSMTFSWVSTIDLEAWTSGECSYSCAQGVDAFSLDPILHHELAHALFYELNPAPSHFLSEGFATAMDPLQLGNYMAVSSRDPRDILTNSTFSSGYYAEAGLFVAYLIQVLGVEKFRDLYQLMTRDSRLEDWASAFQSIYGASLDVVVEDYLATVACPTQVAAFPQFECGAPLLASEADGWHLGRVLDCGDQDVVGGIDAEGGLAMTVTFRVETPGDYEIRFSAPGVAKSLVRLGACERCRWLPQEVQLGGNQSSVVFLDAGLHFLTVRVFETTAQEIAVDVTPAM